MRAIQLEFNLDNETDSEAKLSYMQKQIDDMHESMGKVRRKLFAQVGEIQKEHYALKQENVELKKTLKEMKGEKTEWIYAQGDSLFDVREYQKACG